MSREEEDNLKTFAEFSPGDAVCLVGLQSFAKLNGQHGTLLSYDDERKRWQVELKDGVRNVLVSNLSRKPQATPQRQAKQAAKRPMHSTKDRLGMQFKRCNFGLHRTFTSCETLCLLSWTLELPTSCLHALLPQLQDETKPKRTCSSKDALNWC